MLNLVVDHLAGAASQITGRWIVTGETQSATNGVEVCSIDDPDSNVITLSGNFRVQH